jgi:hypothetical protein
VLAASAALPCHHVCHHYSVCDVRSRRNKRKACSAITPPRPRSPTIRPASRSEYLGPRLLGHANGLGDVRQAAPNHPRHLVIGVVEVRPLVTSAALELGDKALAKASRCVLTVAAVAPTPGVSIGWRCVQKSFRLVSGVSSHSPSSRSASVKYSPSPVMNAVSASGDLGSTPCLLAGFSDQLGGGSPPSTSLPSGPRRVSYRHCRKVITREAAHAGLLSWAGLLEISPGMTHRVGCITQSVRLSLQTYKVRSRDIFGEGLQIWGRSLDTPPGGGHGCLLAHPAFPPKGG